MGGSGHGFFQRAGERVAHAALKGRGEILRGLADEIGLLNLREILGQRLDAACLGYAARDPENAVIGGKGAGRRIRIGGLAVIDETHTALVCRILAHLLHAVRETGEAGQPFGNLGGVVAEHAHGREGGGGVFPIVCALKGGNVREVGGLFHPRGPRVIDLAAQHIDPAAQRLARRDGNDLRPALG